MNKQESISKLISLLKGEEDRWPIRQWSAWCSRVFVNNTAERALRVVALGRKNFLFAGSNAGGERAAAIYSLLGSAKLNGLDPGSIPSKRRTITAPVFAS